MRGRLRPSGPLSCPRRACPVSRFPPPAPTDAFPPVVSGDTCCTRRQWDAGKILLGTRKSAAPTVRREHTCPWPVPGAVGDAGGRKCDRVPLRLPPHGSLSFLAAFLMAAGCL